MPEVKPLDRPVPWILVPALFAGVLAAPAWSQFDALSTYYARAGDFVYLAGATSWSETLRHLFKPYNAHVVPLFRLWTFGVASLAGSAAATPRMMLLSSYAVFVSAILGVGHLVAWESRSLARALFAMAGVGVSSVLAPTVAWYSAGQALMAGAAILTMLEALQFYRIDGRRIWVALGTLTAFAAPWVWSGGYVGGAVGFVYLRLDDRPASRRMAWFPLAASVLTLVLSVATAGTAMFASGEGRGTSLVSGASHAVQAVPAILVAANLGVDPETTAPQRWSFALLIVGLWFRTRGGPRRLQPLEGAGATMVLAGLGLPFTFRGRYEFENIQSIFWYQAIPQLGVFLFLAGWCSAAKGESDAPGPPRRPTFRQTLILLGLIALLLVVHAPRVSRGFLEQVPPIEEKERSIWPTHALQMVRARYFALERVARQTRFLARLDQVERLAQGAQLSRETLRRASGRVLGPGMSDRSKEIDAVSLLDLPETGGAPLSPALRADLAVLLKPEPAVRPAGLPAGEPWRPKEW